tara:strand:- start:291 stop:1046 length:756 start_codon:yes stop_codon:yes gene_type:complete
MLNNLVVALSGGAGRLGSAFSEEIIKNGGKVIIGDVNEKNGKKLERELGKNSLFINCDFTVPNEIEKFINHGENTFGQIDAAVHCSYPRSSQWGTSFEKLEASLLKEDLFNQLGGAILFSQKFVNYFKKNQTGNLIHISSIQGISAPKFEHYFGTDMVSPIEYSAIKSGIISISKYLAKYLKDSNIRVNCISPGGIIDGQPPTFLEKYKASCLSKGMLDSDDISGTLIFLLSNKSSFINGQNIIVDDGWTL